MEKISEVELLWSRQPFSQQEEMTNITLFKQKTNKEVLDHFMFYISIFWLTDAEKFRVEKIVVLFGLHFLVKSEKRFRITEAELVSVDIL